MHAMLAHSRHMQSSVRTPSTALNSGTIRYRMCDCGAYDSTRQASGRKRLVNVREVLNGIF